MQKIVPHLWFDKEAKEAAEWYVSLFPDSKVASVTTMHNTPSGDVDVVSFSLSGYSFMAISAGPLFTFNPSVSFILNFDPSKDAEAEAHLDAVWEKVAEGGTVRMELGDYPFSKRYGWVADKYGVNWQLMLTDPAGEERPFIIPTLLFVTEGGEAAEEATDFYLSVFKNSRRGALARYPAGMPASPDASQGGKPNKEGAVMFTDFMLENQWFAAMDGPSAMHTFAFNEAISFIVNCEDQAEIDYYWEKLSAHPESEQCGWLKDTYGFSWQIVPRAMDEMMASGTPEQIDRVTKAFLPMKKIDLAALQKAYEGEA